MGLPLPHLHRDSAPYQNVPKVLSSVATLHAALCESRKSPLRCLMSAECSQIVHRDVKAPNVLLREADGCYDACISDFGTVFQPPTLRSFEGTPASMSPEQLKVAPPRRFRTMDVALVGRGCGLRTLSGLLSSVARPAKHRMWYGTTRVLHCAVPQESERITTKADCYGFAVLMWELATRLYPWLGLGLLHVRTMGMPNRC